MYRDELHEYHTKIDQVAIAPHIHARYIDVPPAFPCTADARELGLYMLIANILAGGMRHSDWQGACCCLCTTLQWLLARPTVTSRVHSLLQAEYRSA